MFFIRSFSSLIFTALFVEVAFGSAFPRQTFVISRDTFSQGGSIILENSSSTTSIAVSTNSASQPIPLNDGASQLLTIPTSSPTQFAVVVNGNTVTLNSNSNLVISQQSLTPAGSINLGRGSVTTALVLLTNSARQPVFINSGTTQTLTTPLLNPSKPVVVLGSTTVSNSVITGQTLTQGGLIVHGDSTPVPGIIPTVVPVVLGSQTIAPKSKSQYIISGQTVTLGGFITLNSGSSTTVRALSADSAHHTVHSYRSITSTLSNTAPAMPSTIMFGSQTITANAKSDYIFSGRTSTTGEPLTIGNGSTTTYVELTSSSAHHTILLYGNKISTLVSGITSTTILIGSTTTSAGGFTASSVGGNASGTPISTASPSGNGAGRERSALTFWLWSIGALGCCRSGFQ
ncbi:hypothetical protein EJ08DRAFT_664533 [Tothia fuscella]|uniref:Uncharacterized protein n=1 Tax=Tothia fuscella TaxID=1048955 RepID=A0A9P4NJ58_9PEZI|nr:hypothetical protein EJ08DRAFT_664533 [Tothia fuscella]